MANNDLDCILDYCLRFAQQMLATHGEFFPFGASIEEGKELAADGFLLEDEHPPSQKVIDLYTEMYRLRANSLGLKAAGICWDSRIVIGNGEKTDAISVGLEHRDGECVMVCLPYTTDPRRGYQYGDLIAYQRIAQFFNR